jgi:putative aldouronate transport system substrate-binding protein
MFSDDVINEYGELKITLDEYITENVARFITNDLSLESDWDKYLDELEKIGYSRYIEIVNQGYTRQYK